MPPTPVVAHIGSASFAPTQQTLTSMEHLIRRAIEYVNAFANVEGYSMMKRVAHEIQETSNQFPMESEIFGTLLNWMSRFDKVFVKKLRAAIDVYIHPGGSHDMQKFYTSIVTRSAS